MRAKQNFSHSVIIAALFCILLSTTRTAHAEIMRICDDEAGWPPYVYNPIVDGKPDKSQITGATIELLDAIFREINQDYTLELLPWKRCLNEVEGYPTKGKFEAFSNGSYSEERARLYHTSLPIYSLDRGVFYSTEKFPNGIDVSSLEKIKNYRVCGVHGYTYELWGLGEGEIDLSPKSSAAALKMVSLGRCDVFPSNITPIYGQSFIGEPIVPSDINVYMIDYIPARNFHIFISRGSERGETILKTINNAISLLKENGVYDEIFDRYYRKIGLHFLQGKFAR